MSSFPWRRFCHWGPLSVLCIIKLVTWAMVHVIGMWWPPHGSLSGALHAAMFLLFALSTLYFFLQSTLEGPGFVPLGWKPKKEEDTKHLQYCTVCNGYKAPRSHHCKKCGGCVLKMDHHCPWINCCVGHANHACFNIFLACAVVGCLHASIVLPICVYHAIHRVWYLRHGMGDEPIINLTLNTLLLVLLAVGMALGVVLAVSALLFFQLRGIFRNQTTIEEWIIEKAVSRRQEHGLPPFVFPYDLGWRENFRQALQTKSDGLSWPVKEGCDEYDLTREQQAQKLEKRLRSRLFVATRPYSSRWVPILSYPRAAIAFPCSDESRLPLQPGDIIAVTRHRKHWLFGERRAGAGAGGGEERGPRGWFPRAAAVPAAPAAPSADTLKVKPD